MARRDSTRISLLYSSSGTYASLGREAVAGAMAAIAEVNADDTRPFRLEPVIGDPAGTAERYAELADDAIRNRGVRHVIGTITSWSRKEVLPVVERHGALLWYAFPYEGYEVSDHALYLGACPNQHLLPLFDYVLPRFGGRPMVIGSNYIWGWEIGRIAREIVEVVGGEVVAERYLPLGAVDVQHLIAEIRERRPDFILSNLVGESAAAFLAAYGELGQADPDFLPSVRPIVSCNSTEADLVGAGALAAGHITTSIYFDGIETAENAAFKQRLQPRMGRVRYAAPFVAGYTAVAILAAAMAEAGSDDPRAVRQLVTTRKYDTPLGTISVDPKTHHAALRPHLGRATAQGHFEVVQSAPQALAADPFLVNSRLSSLPLRRQTTPPDLQVVTGGRASS